MEFLASEPVIVSALFSAVLGSTWIGITVGRRTRRRKAPDDAHLGTIQGGTLGLLGLLLGFAFAGAMGRFTDRQHGIRREANAIGTASLRADLLEASEREAFNAHLLAYARSRLRLFQETNAQKAAQIGEELHATQLLLWAIVVKKSRETPVLAATLLAPLNEVFDLLGERDELANLHLPLPVYCLLISSACLSMCVLGYGVGLAQRRSLGSAFALAAIIAVALWVTVDLDFPRRGLIRLDPGLLAKAAEQLAGSGRPVPP